MLKLRLALVLVVASSLATMAQTTNEVQPMDHTPTFQVTVVSRSVQAINYQHRSGATKIDFAGTDLMPQANGQAKVESKKGNIRILNVLSTYRGAQLTPVLRPQVFL